MATKQEPFRVTKLRSRILLVVILLISFAAFVYAHDQQYDDQDHSFRAGYTAGYGHGNSDQQARTNFNFRHDREYQRGATNHRDNVSQESLNFRLGYVEGYADGYFRKNPLFAFHQQNSSQVQYDSYYGSRNQGAVTVFTGTRYQGYSQEFGIGTYPKMEGRLDDDIQSVRVYGSLRVILFEHDKFRGKSIVIERDTLDLGNFKRKAGSMIIEPIRYGQIR